jgi:hypothetical protein
MVPVLIDWITVTHREWNKWEHLTPVLLNRCIRGEVHEGKHPTGARGWYGERVFIGMWDNGMLLVQASSHWAQVVADRIAEVIPSEGMSVARLDLQATVWVADADAIVATTVPSRRYKCTLIRNLYGKGCTLYVGAPSSDARLRMYNKSVESGQYPSEGGEWLRIELQLRNKYADRAWVNWRKRVQGNFLLEWLRKMADMRTYLMVKEAIEHGDEPAVDQDTDDDWVTRRLYWLQHTVVPALRRLALHDEYTRRQVALALNDIMGVDMSFYQHLSD